jgi:hypothetical protein
MLEIGSQQLADNESIHGSLGKSYENQEEIGVSMVIQNEPSKVENEENIAIEQQALMSKKAYDRLIKSKRHQKSLKK